MPVLISPDVPPQIRELIAEHSKLEDETLLLAVLFTPERNPNDIFIFEVIDGFGAGNVDEEKELFEVAYASTAAFPIRNGGRLRLILTNPEEFEVALDEKWPSMEEVRKAVQTGQSTVIYSDPSRPDLEEKLRG